MRKRELYIGLIIVIAASVLLTYWLLPQPQGTGIPDAGGDSETSPGPLLVVPEMPLGTLGILIAFIAAMILMQLSKRAPPVKL